MVCRRLAESRPSNSKPAGENLLLRRAQRGERQAFGMLVDHYWPRLYRWLYHLTHDQHAAEDLAQETFLKAYAALDSFRVGTHFQAWLFRIAHNSFLNQRRVTSRVRQPLPEQLPCKEIGPAEQAMSKEAVQLLVRAVGRLPTDFRSALLLRVEEGLSFREIAEVLNTTEQTARWRVFKARQKLLQVLASQLDREKT